MARTHISNLAFLILLLGIPQVAFAARVEAAKPGRRLLVDPAKCNKAYEARKKDIDAAMQKRRLDCVKNAPECNAASGQFDANACRRMPMTCGEKTAAAAAKLYADAKAAQDDCLAGRANPVAPPPSPPVAPPVTSPAERCVSAYVAQKQAINASLETSTRNCLKAAAQSGDVIVPAGWTQPDLPRGCTDPNFNAPSCLRRVKETCGDGSKAEAAARAYIKAKFDGDDCLRQVAGRATPPATPVATPPAPAATPRSTNAIPLDREGFPRWGTRG